MSYLMTRFLVALAVTVFVFVFAQLDINAAEDRRARVLNDRTEVQSAGHWIYNDFPKALAEAQTTGKPILAVLRCLP